MRVRHYAYMSFSLFLTAAQIQGLARLAVPPHPPTDLTAAQVGSSVLPASIASHVRAVVSVCCMRDLSGV
jgi:hypothetical protein